MMLFDISWVEPLRNEAFTNFLMCIHLLAQEYFYLLFVPLGYWCLNKNIYRDLAILVPATVMLNIWLKLLFQIPRPDLLPHLVSVGTSYSFPSGDVQLITTFWLALAANYRRTGLWILAFTLIPLTAFSRIYFGVHYPADVLAGFIAGLWLVACYFYIKQGHTLLYISKHATLSFLVILLFVVLYLVDIHAHINNHLTLSAVGFLLGALLAHLCDRRWCYYQVPKGLLHKTFVAAIGLGTSLPLYMLIVKLLATSTEYHLILGFSSYLLLSFHLFFIAPLLYQLMLRFTPVRCAQLKTTYYNMM